MDEKTGMQFVVKVEDEATKNHKQNEHDIVTGYMPAINDDKYCPKVASDEKLRMGLTLGYALTGDPSCLTKENERQAPRFTETATITKRPCLHNIQIANSSSSITAKPRAKQSSTYDDSMFEENNAVSDAELLKAVNEYEEATISENVQFMQSSQTDSNKIQCISRQILKKMSPPTFSTNCKIEG
ncbi:Hypothetical predicted protein [Paramuricea clavata]|uniref:Uncharacterized protein n=1 Tax=Paramuricea clavata TaxID=317549 RepID=A0A7D9IWY5_PARCT|nr:Hypothetical predicted protein [Paramuricea clavata]